MMKTADRPNFSLDIPQRETAPKGWIRPVEKEEKAPFQVAKEKFAQWTRTLNTMEALFTEHVYENPNFSVLDARMHRASLHSLIGDGEMLVVDMTVLNLSSETESYISFVEGHLKRLHVVLHEWHGPLDVSVGIPEDFVTGMRQFSEGKIVDLEKALEQAPA